MVLHFIDRIIGHSGDNKYYLRDHTFEDLVEIGFNEKEAQQLAWIENQRNRGTYLGLFSGLGFLYFTLPAYKTVIQSLPYLRYQPHFGFLLKAGTIALFVEGGRYLASSRREAGNFWFSNLYSNNIYTKSKESFLKNFQTLNRPFTADEVNQFNENRVRERQGVERKWIYNPHLHGDSEEQFRQNIDLYFNKKVHPSQKPQAQLDIQTQNSEKIQSGEKVNQIPYNLINDIDQSGSIHGLQTIPISSYGSHMKVY